MTLLLGIATALCIFATTFPVITTAQAEGPKIKVTLLGTAGPEYFPDRLGISTLVEATLNLRAAIFSVATFNLT